MYFIKKPKTINLKQFKKNKSELDAFYGLPREVLFCKECCFSNQKPNSEQEYKHSISTKKPTVNFDSKNICSACKTSRLKKNIDWKEREKMLIDLCNKYRRDDGRYDCIVPGSGGKDSFYASYMLKYKYGMKPLTVTWAPMLYTEWGWKNFQAWIGAGFCNYSYTPNKVVQRYLTRLSLEKLFHPFQPFIMGQMYFPPKISYLMDIPLVFYGENPTEYGNNIKENEIAQKEQNYFSKNNYDDLYVAGININELIENYYLTKLDLDPYLPIDQNKILEKKIDVQYLGFYLPWHPQECYYTAVEKGGFQAAPERTLGTYSKYSSIDDKLDDFHYYTTYIKFGIGRATYDASQEIRSGDIDRNEGLALIKRFDGEYPDRFSKDIFEFLTINKNEDLNFYKVFENPEMNKDYFSNLTDNFRSPHLWKFKNDRWELRNTVFSNIP